MRCDVDVKFVWCQAVVYSQDPMTCSRAELTQGGNDVTTWLLREKAIPVFQSYSQHCPKAIEAYPFAPVLPLDQFL